MMPIMTGNGEIMFLDRMEAIKIVEFESSYSIAAYPADDGKKARMIARYHMKATAQEELKKLLDALYYSDTPYCAAPSMYDLEERQIHDARVRRKGGS